MDELLPEILPSLFSVMLDVRRPAYLWVRMLIGMMGDVGARTVNVLGAFVQRATTLAQCVHADEMLIEKDVWRHCGDWQARFTEVGVPRHEEKASIAVLAYGAS